MFVIEPFKYAPEWVKRVAEDKLGSIAPQAYAILRDYTKSLGDDVGERHPSLRNREGEATAMLRGLVNGSDSLVIMTVRETGGGLSREYGFEAVGAQFTQHFVVMFA